MARFFIDFGMPPVVGKMHPRFRNRPLPAQYRIKRLQLGSPEFAAVVRWMHEVRETVDKGPAKGIDLIRWASVRQEASNAEIAREPYLQMVALQRARYTGSTMSKTDYDQSNACTICNAGEVRRGPFRLIGGDRQTKLTAYTTLVGEWIVSSPVLDELVKKELTGFRAIPVEFVGSKTTASRHWFLEAVDPCWDFDPAQPYYSESLIPRLSSEVLCVCRKSRNAFVLPPVAYTKTRPGTPPDFSVTCSGLGHSDFGGRPFRDVVVSQRFREVFDPVAPGVADWQLCRCT